MTGPRGLDVYLGTPESEDGRVVAVELPTAEELIAYPDAVVVASAKGSLRWLALPEDEPNMLVECNTERFRRAGTPAGGAWPTGGGWLAFTRRSTTTSAAWGGCSTPTRWVR